MKKNILLIILFISIIIIIMCSGKQPDEEHLTSTGLSIEENLQLLNIPAEYIPFEYTVPDGMIENETEKQAMIDAKIDHLREVNKLFWGKAPDQITREYTFEDIWDIIDSIFPGFQGLDLDWDEFRDTYYNEINKAKTYGEFANIMTLFAYSLKEGHSQIIPGKLYGPMDEDSEYPLNYNLDKAPVFFPSTITKIGACYTVTEKDELVVSKTWDDSPDPYNLKIGDEIIGFNGVEWSKWIPALEKSGLPIYGSPAAAPSSIRYTLLRSAMANPYLFEKINIKRIDTGEIETMEVVYVEEQDTAFCTELTETENLVDIDDSEKILSWKDDPTMVYGILKDKNIGYMYIKECPDGFNDFDDVSEWDPYETEFSTKFEEAVLSLMETDGIIIDLRYNGGGRQEVFYKGLAHIIDASETLLIYEELERNSYEEGRENYTIIESERYEIYADEPNQYYENPIVVMMGPDCISACDYLVGVMEKFPETFTIIGRHSNASFTSLMEDEYIMEDGDYVFKYIPSSAAAYADDADKILLRSEEFLDIDIWYNKEDVVNQIDTVRNYAIELIEKEKEEN